MDGSLRLHPSPGKAERASRLRITSVAAAQWDFNQDLAEKLMRLALRPAAPQGEWQAAALAYFRVLRAGEVSADELREMLGIVQEQPEPAPDTTPMVSFGRHRDRTVRWIVEHDPSYAEWLLRKAVNLSPALHSEFRRELWRRYGTQSGESSRSRAS